MTTQIDLDKLEQVARAVNDHSDAIGESSWYSADDDVMIFKPSPDLAMIAELSPTVVLELVRRLRAAEADAKRREDYIEALHAERVGGAT